MRATLIVLGLLVCTGSGMRHRPLSQKTETAQHAHSFAEVEQKAEGSPGALRNLALLLLSLNQAAGFNVGSPLSMQQHRARALTPAMTIDRHPLTLDRRQMGHGFRPARVCTRKPSIFMRAADALIEEADALHSAKKFDAVFDLLAGADVTDDELAWRIARAYHDKAEEITADDLVRERLLREGLAVAEAAKERSAGASTASHGYALKWYAILLGRLGDYLPTKEKVANSYKIKEALEASATLLPEDSSVQFGLGQWCYKVAGISFIERNAAKLLFGQPPASSYAEALSYLEASYALKANKKAALFAGLCQAKLKDKAAARE